MNGTMPATVIIESKFVRVMHQDKLIPQLLFAFDVPDPSGMVLGIGHLLAAFHSGQCTPVQRSVLIS